MTRVAVFVPGSLGNPALGHYVPAQFDLLSRLSRLFDMTVFWLDTTDGDNALSHVGRVPVNFVGVGRNAPFHRKVGVLIRRAQEEHKRSRFNLVHGFWGSPCWTAEQFAGLYNNLLHHSVS